MKLTALIPVAEHRDGEIERTHEHTSVPSYRQSTLWKKLKKKLLKHLLILRSNKTYSINSEFRYIN